MSTKNLKTKKQTTEKHAGVKRSNPKEENTEPTRNQKSRKRARTLNSILNVIYLRDLLEDSMVLRMDKALVSQNIYLNAALKLMDAYSAYSNSDPDKRKKAIKALVEGFLNDGLFAKPQPKTKQANDTGSQSEDEEENKQPTTINDLIDSSSATSNVLGSLLEHLQRLSQKQKAPGFEYVSFQTKTWDGETFMLYYEDD